ncbi:MAG: hypothetical protein HWE34_05365 [Methylocystaceae bacterium]|nr:hypothetical protein [Methylocystaceae bacterium]
MTSFQNDLRLNQDLTCNEVTELCILGILFNDGHSENSLLKVVRSFDTGSWQPTRDVLTHALTRLLQAQAVITWEFEKTQYFSINAIGIKRYFNLLQKPLTRDRLLINTLLVLKSAFLETLPQPIQGNVIQQLVQYYQNQLDFIQTNCIHCPLNQHQQHRQNTYKLNHIQLELDWLSNLQIQERERPS